MTVTIRGKILLAFCVLGTITGFLGLSAVNSVVESGRLVVDTYDRPLMSISYARLALSDFMALRLALMQRQTANPHQQHVLDARMDELARSVREDLVVAEQRSSSAAAAAAARHTLLAAAEWNRLRERIIAGTGTDADRAALEEGAAAIVTAFDDLVEFTAEDGFRGRERALRSIDTYRWLSVACTLAALLLGGIVAILLARRMVRPIAAASSAASRIAEGELDVEIVSAGDDELGRLLDSMARMRDNIRAMMEREIAARRSAQARLVNAIESSAEGVILVDGDNRILIANSQVASFFPDFVDSLAPGAPFPIGLDAVLERNMGEVRLADGRWIRLSRSSTADGGFVVIGSDITLLKERETALQAAKDEAEAASRAKSEFLANMSHELRTPLNAVIGFSEIIASEMFGAVGQPKYRDFAVDILRSGRHLLEVINDILDIAKLQSGTTELRLESVQITELIDDSIRIVREQAESGGIALTRSIGQRLPKIEADATRVRQVLLNLLSNAIKFTPTGGHIEVTAEHAPEGIRVAVRDTGIGMEAASIPKALEPFGQVDSSIARKYGGTGLGLPLSKLFTELHGGRLTIESAPGKGTTVTVILPAPVRERPAPLAVAI
jgi:signal transduction histidine kinase/HAMP domain-containing protein